MKIHRIAVRLDKPIDPEPFKFGLMKHGFTFGKSLGRDTILIFCGAEVGFFRTTSRMVEITCPIPALVGIMERALALGLLTKYANRKRLRVEVTTVEGDATIGVLKR